MSGWTSAQRYKFNDYVFDQNMWVSILDEDITSPGATTMEVHLGFKSRSKDAVMDSYEKVRQMFFASGIKSGKFYYKSDTEYIPVNIVAKQEILHPKGKGYYVMLRLVAEDSANIKEIRTDAEEPELITPSTNIYTYMTASENIAPTPFELTLTIKTAIEWIKVGLNQKNLGFQFSLAAGDVVKIETGSKEIDIIRAGKLIKKIYADGIPLQIMSGKNDMMFVTDVEDPMLELFEVVINVQETV